MGAAAPPPPHPSPRPPPVVLPPGNSTTTSPLEARLPNLVAAHRGNFSGRGTTAVARASSSSSSRGRGRSSTKQRRQRGRHHPGSQPRATGASTRRLHGRRTRCARLGGFVAVWATGKANSRGKRELPRGSSSSNNKKATRWVPCRKCICVVHVRVCVFVYVFVFMSSFLSIFLCFFVETEGSVFDVMLA